MPTLKILPHGLTVGVPPGKNDHPRALRGVCGGWSESSTRSNTRFLRSVDIARLAGTPLSVTLTVRDCPPSHKDWQRLREALFNRLDRLGLTRKHWLTEWQKRRVPHLHACLWFPPLPSDQLNALRASVCQAWIECAAEYRPLHKSQTVKPMYDALGWLKYLAKHATRGLGHYQRSRDSIPPGWQKTGRMWGYSGDWPTEPALVFKLEPRALFPFRRMIQRWRFASARAETNPGARRARMAAARRMLRDPNPGASSTRGCSEWLELPDALTLLAFLASNGYQVEQSYG